MGYSKSIDEKVSSFLRTMRSELFSSEGSSERSQPVCNAESCRESHSQPTTDSSTMLCMCVLLHAPSADEASQPATESSPTQSAGPFEDGTPEQEKYRKIMGIPKGIIKAWYEEEFWGAKIFGDFDNLDDGLKISVSLHCFDYLREKLK